MAELHDPNLQITAIDTTVHNKESVSRMKTNVLDICFFAVKLFMKVKINVINYYYYKLLWN